MHCPAPVVWRAPNGRRYRVEGCEGHRPPPGRRRQHGRLASQWVLPAGAEVQIYAAALPLDLVVISSRVEARPVDQQRCVADAVFEAAGAGRVAGQSRRAGGIEPLPSSRLDAGEAQGFLPVAAVA